MNYKEGGHARIEGGNPSGIIIPLFMNGCSIIPSKVNLLAKKINKPKRFLYKDLRLIILKLKI